jgi:hypothetical protein
VAAVPGDVSPTPLKKKETNQRKKERKNKRERKKGRNKEG